MILADAIDPSLFKVKLPVAFSPLPVIGIKGILLSEGDKEKPEPELTISLPVIAAPLPSMIPVTLNSSGSIAAPVLTFLPIGNAL